MKMKRWKKQRAKSTLRYEKGQKREYNKYLKVIYILKIHILHFLEIA